MERAHFRTIAWILLAAAFIVLLWLCLFTGTVEIPFAQTWTVLTGGEASKTTWTHIVTDLRVPSAVTAALAGAALSVAGLMLQTTFNNPLAGPSILGVSTGASLGVAIVMLAAPAWLGSEVTAIVGATVGALAVIALLSGFSAVVRSSVMLLIVGIMLGYLTSALISLLNFYATREGVHSYVIWGLGDFTGVGTDHILPYSLAVAALLGLAMLMVKPLDALLMGERYAAATGTDVSRSRTVILLVAGLLVAVTTAFCGPIGFLGLAVPHVARLMMRTAAHHCLLPATALAGAVAGLLTLWLSTLPAHRGMLPVNSITPLIGVPVVVYIVVRRHRLNYFN